MLKHDCPTILQCPKYIACGLQIFLEQCVLGNFKFFVICMFSFLMLESKGLKAMAKEIIGVDLDKSSYLRMGNWEAEVFTPEQVSY